MSIYIYIHTHTHTKLLSRTVVAEAEFNKKKALLTRKLYVNVRKKLLKCYRCRTALCGTETWTLRKVDQKHLESFETW
jgi:hypothetical protein